MSNPLAPIGAAFKAGYTRLRQMVFPTGRSGGWWGSWSWGQRQHPWAWEVGDGRGGSIVEPTLRWIGRNFSEARPRVRRPQNGDLEPVEGHELVRLLRRPNPYYSGITLWQATVPDWKASGDAYWYKVRSAGGRVVQLWWLPSVWVEPRWDATSPTSYIDWYDYTVGGQTMQLDPRDVIHFRNGINPHNTRKGFSDLACVLGEIFTDAEAGMFVSTLLHNLGVPGAFIAPTGDGSIDPADGELLKQGYMDRTTGAHRGEPLIIPSPVDIKTIAFNPRQMDVRSLRQVAEERITAALGPPAIVVGMGAGLARSTFANFREAREAATEAELVPDWRFFAEEIQQQLLPDFDNPMMAEFDFDLSEVRTLQEDQNALWVRLDNALGKGAITLNESRTARGLDTLPDGDVYYLPINVTVTPQDQIGQPPDPAVPENPAPDAPPQPPEPRKALDLPGRELTSEAGWLNAAERLRANVLPTGQAEVLHFLDGQRSRIIASLTESKAAMQESLDWDHEDERLTQALRPTYTRALTGTVDLMRQYTEADLVVDDALVRSYLNAAGQQISGINHTTRRMVQKALADSVGEPLEAQIQRIQQLTGFNASRAEMIAQTELGASTALATTHAAVLASVPYLTIHDPDGSDHGFTGCTDRHGKVIPTQEGFTVGLAHPRCKVQLIPTTRAPVTQRSNGHVPTRELANV